MKLSRYHLEKRAKQGFRGYPIATIAFYGATADFASKVVVAVYRTEGPDVRFDEGVGDRVLSVIQSHGVQSVVMTDSIIGCPHEEGTDYPEGTPCPQCPFWAGRDRFTHERIH